MRKIIAGIFSVQLFFSCLNIVAGEKKEIKLPVDTGSTAPNTFPPKIINTDSTRSFIRHMNEQQLQTLIDYLFEMDSIPSDVITEVNLAAINHRKDRSATIESQDLWDEKNVFCWKEMNQRLDTAFVVDLLEKEKSIFTLPVVGVMTCPFGWHKSYNHNGVDIDLRRGTKVQAAFDGVVRIAKWVNGYGYVVVVRHASGLETLYAHLSKIKVKTGQLLNSGDVVGLGGATGNATGPHLHFEVRLKSKPINPKYLIDFDAQNLVCDKFVFKSARLGWAVYPPDTKEYYAQKGDTIFEIAKRFGLQAKTLAQQNGLNQWLRLKPGQRIVIG